VLVIRIYGKEYPDILIKVSKREYLEDIIQGKLYFNNAEYFRDIETDSSKDSREGKVRIDTSKLNDNDPIFDFNSIFSPEELNLSVKSSQKTPIFCCSVLERNMLIPKGKGEFDLSKAYLKEMEKWGNCVLVFSLHEFCSKVYNKCFDQNIIPLMKKITYDQEENSLSYSEFVELMKFNKYDVFFHKTNAYKNQHEFRVVLGGANVAKDKGNYILNIGKLELATIFELESLGNLGLRIKIWEDYQRNSYK